MDFLNFPKDIQVMIITYLHPQEAFHMFVISKYTNDLIKLYKLQDRIIKRFLDFRTIKEFEEDLETLNICPKCEYVFPNNMKKQAIQIHLRKHEHGKQMQQVSKRNILTKTICHQCKCPKSNQTVHVCQSQQIHCYAGDIGYYFPWADTLCEKTLWFKIEPLLKTHICKAKCRFCKEEFSPMDEEEDVYHGYSIHYKNCKEQERINIEYKIIKN